VFNNEDVHTSEEGPNSRQLSKWTQLPIREISIVLETEMSISAAAKTDMWAKSAAAKMDIAATNG
jgi:hypothetical protein